MTEKMGLSFVTHRRTENDPPLFVLEDFTGEWRAEVWKSHQAGNEAKKYARWMVSVSSPMTWGGTDLGDNYVETQLNMTPILVEVAGREPTAEEKAEIAELHLAVAGMGAVAW